MRDKFYTSPSWMKNLKVLVPVSLLTSLLSIAALSAGILPNRMGFLAILGALSPSLLLTAILPVLNEQTRILSSLRLAHVVLPSGR